MFIKQCSYIRKVFLQAVQIAHDTIRKQNIICLIFEKKNGFVMVYLNLSYNNSSYVEFNVIKIILKYVYAI